MGAWVMDGPEPGTLTMSLTITALVCPTLINNAPQRLVMASRAQTLSRYADTGHLCILGTVYRENMYHYKPSHQF